jgi:hypothetical protein
MSDTDSDLKLRITEGCPTERALNAAARATFEHPSTQKHLTGTRFRLLSLQALEPSEKTHNPVVPEGYRAAVYDYTNNRNLLIEGRLDDPGNVEISVSDAQALPTDEEFDAAVAILQRDETISRAICDQHLQVYRPMPPLIAMELADGRIERTLAVGLFSPNDAVRHRIVGVNLVHDTVVHDVAGFVGVADSSALDCGPPTGQSCPVSGGPGQVNVTVSQGTTTLWTFTVVRPSASSGTNGSGVELRLVDYRGKRVLYRAHVPILNVEYQQDGTNAGCGPTYRDWQSEEACFQANGVDVVPGIRLCSSPAQTILDTGSDAGNFRGVAVYVQGLEVVLVSELRAGWYRYISEWRLHANGTIRSRFGFGAASNPCTCHAHHHHAYWRLDFDIRTAQNNFVEEYNDPPLFPPSHWHTKHFEIRRPRDAAHQRRWRVRNSITGEGYTLVPGTNDGNADAYGVGDLWVLRYHGNELDDGQGFTTVPALSRANIDKFVNGEPVENQDVVLWYVGHFLHDAAHGGGHIVGPNLEPFNW